MVTQRPILLLLPGTLCDERIFTRVKRALKCNVTIVCASYHGMKDRSQWLGALLKRLPQQFYVAGFSLGGLFALEMLRLAGERLQGIALIASNAQPASPQSQRKSAFLRKLWLERGPAVVAKHVKPAYFHHEAKRRKYERLVFDMALQTPRHSAFQEFAWAAMRPSGLQTLHGFEGSVLAVSGAQDRLCPRAWQQALVAAQPCTQWREISRCGHFLPLEAPVQLAHALKNWIFNQYQPLAGKSIA
ncbi:MAG: alpha/beta fold hydrolase [Brachymonas sp.]